MGIIYVIILAFLFAVVLTLLFFHKRIFAWLKLHKKLGVIIITSMIALPTGALLYLGDQPSNEPIILDAEAFIWHSGNGYGGMSHWEINKTYAKKFLKEQFKWRLQASPNNLTWYDANELLKIGLNWNDEDCSYKVTLTLNTTGALQALYYRFDLACNKSLKQYLQIDGYEWTLTVPANNTKDYILKFNWSDIKPLIQSGKIWFDRGVTNNFFWFRIQSVNKIAINKEFVVDPAYGIIPAAVTDSWEWHGGTGASPDMVRCGTSQYYLIISSQQGTDGWLNTVRIWNDNGTIQKSNVSTYEFDTSYCEVTGPAICHVSGNGGSSGDIYAGVYQTGDPLGRVFTIKVWHTNGTIKPAKIDTQNLLAYGWQYDIIPLSQNMVAVAYQDGATTDGFISTLYIDSTGAISGMNSTVEFNTSDARSPRMTMVDSDTIVLVYDGGTAGSNDGYVTTMNVSTSTGIITNTSKANQWEFDTTQGSRPDIKKISDNTYAIAYVDTNSDVQIKTLSIATNGVITKSWIDTLSMGAETCNYPTLFTVNNRSVYGVTYQWTGADGVVKTFNCSASGILGDAIIDYLEFDTADDIYLAPISWVNKSWYFIVYEGTGNDGWSCTVSIDTNWANPTFSNPSPANNSVNQALTPQCAITTSDKNGDLLSLYWYSSPDGTTWTYRAKNSSVAANGTYYWTDVYASSGHTKYYWKVSANDTTHNVTAWYCFTTSNTVPAFSNPIPANNSNTQALRPQCTITLADANGDAMSVRWYTNTTGSWILRQTNTSQPNGTYKYTYSLATAYGTKYYWKVAVNDTISNTSKWYAFTTRTETDAIFSNPYPTNGSTGVTLGIRCNITIADTQGDSMTLRWYENSTGAYVLRQTNSSCVNGTYRWVYTQASTNSHKYYWKVAANDTITNVSKWYAFTTVAAAITENITITNPYPTNGSTGISTGIRCNITINHSRGLGMVLKWYENSTGSWVLRQTNGSASSPFVPGGTIYYVATTGNDATGTGAIGSPWRSLRKANNMSTAGDTIYVRGGTYYFNNGNKTIINKNGTATNWITYMSYPGETVIIDGRNQLSTDPNSIIMIYYASYIRFSGFKLYNAPRSAVHIMYKANYIRIDNCSIWNTSQRGIVASPEGTGLNVENITVEYNTLNWTNNNWKGNCGGETISFGGTTVKNWAINHNVLHGDFSAGLCIDAKSGANHGVIHHNIINTTVKTIPHYGWDLGCGIYIDGYDQRNHNISIYNNLIFGNSTAINVGAEEATGSSENITIFNNVINLTKGCGVTSSSLGRGFVLSDNSAKTPLKDISFYSNTIYCSSDVASYGACLRITDYKEYLTRIRIENNIFVYARAVSETRYLWSFTKINSTDTLTNILTIDYNVYYRYHTTYVCHNNWKDADDKLWGTHSRVDTNPLLANMLGGNFHLNSTSPAIDTALSTLSPTTDYDGGIRPANVTYDIGAYEWNSVVPPSVAYNGTYRWVFTQASAVSTKYYWKVAVNDTYHNVTKWFCFTTSSVTTYTATIRTYGTDYFTWLGTNTTAYFVYKNLTGLNEATEYVAIFNNSGMWGKYYGDKTGWNFTIHTFDVVRTYMDDAVNNITFNMVSNPNVNYAAHRTVNLKKVGNGYNYTGYTNSTASTLSGLNTTLDLAAGYYVGLWNRTTFTWNYWISGFGITDKNVARWNVIVTKIEANKTWVL